MRGLVVLVGLVVALTVGYVLVTFLLVKRGVAPSAAEVARSSEEDTLIAQFAKPTLRSSDAGKIPTRTDFIRILRDGAVEVLMSVEGAQQDLQMESDLLERYPPDGVPGAQVQNYLAQNERWQIVVIRSLNERARVLKDTRGKIQAFLTSHPEEASRVGSKVDDAINAGLAAIKPGAAIVQRFAAARAAFTRRHETRERAEFDSAQRGYLDWKAGV